MNRTEIYLKVVTEFIENFGNKIMEPCICIFSVLFIFIGLILMFNSKYYNIGYAFLIFGGSILIAISLIAWVVILFRTVTYETRNESRMRTRISSFSSVSTHNSKE